MVTDFAASKVTVPSPSWQSHRHELDRDHCDPVHSNEVDRGTLSLGVGPSVAVAIQVPDEQSVLNSYHAV